MKLTATQAVQLKMACQKARASREPNADPLKVMMFDLIEHCADAGVIDTLDKDMIGLCHLMLTGKELFPARKKKKKSAEPKLRRGTGSY